MSDTKAVPGTDGDGNITDVRLVPEGTRLVKSPDFANRGQFPRHAELDGPVFMGPATSSVRAVYYNQETYNGSGPHFHHHWMVSDPKLVADFRVALTHTRLTTEDQVKALAIGTELVYLGDEPTYKAKARWFIGRHDSDGTSIVIGTNGKEPTFDNAGYYSAGGDDYQVYLRHTPESHRSFGPGSFMDFGVLIKSEQSAPDQAELEQLRAEVARLRESVRNGRQDLEEFKTKVHDYIIEQAEPHGWCHDGVNRHLDALGLDPWETMYEVSVTCTYSTTVTVEADNEDQARELVEEDPDNYIDFNTRSYDWDEVDAHSAEVA